MGPWLHCHVSWKACETTLLLNFLPCGWAVNELIALIVLDTPLGENPYDA